MDVRTGVLKAGDVMVCGESKVYLIEIKRELDLVSSMNDGRFWEQLEKMKAVEVEGKEVFRLILFEGNPEIFSKRYAGSWRTVDGERRTKYLFRSKGEQKAILMRVHSILEKWGVPIMFTGSEYQTSLYLAGLDSYVGKVKEETVRVKWNVPKEESPERQALEWLGAIVGGKTALALLRQYGSILNIALCFTNPDKAKEIREVKVAGKRIRREAVDRLENIFLTNAGAALGDEVG